jgi:hypothetical protein
MDTTVRLISCLLRLLRGIGNSRLHFRGPTTAACARRTALDRTGVERIREGKFGIQIVASLVNFVLHGSVLPRGHVAINVECFGVFHDRNDAAHGRLLQFVAQTFVGTVGDESSGCPEYHCLAQLRIVM